MRRESWDGPRATGPKGHLSVHGPERSLGNVRIAVRQAHEKGVAFATYCLGTMYRDGEGVFGVNVRVAL